MDMLEKKMKSYSDEDLLMLSGIQHISFCARQWAMIHIEQQWVENVLTVEGHHLHERVDDPFAGETRGDVITLRSVSLVSYSLGLYGKADIIEFIRSEDDWGVPLKTRTGKWLPRPVEYKRGKPKPDERDEVQLCAQAICLEEMHNITIPAGALFYGETRHRFEVRFTDELRRKVFNYARLMHEYFEKGYTPPAEYKSHCKSCSLMDLCMPKNFDKPMSVNQYLNDNLEIE
jgi:CRISPR-associated exonuclease Cas4